MAQHNSLAVPKGIHPGSVTGEVRIPPIDRLNITHRIREGPIAVDRTMQDLMGVHTTAASTVEDLMGVEGIIEIEVLVW